MPTSTPQTVLITGASSGLGIALTREFLRQGYFVIATARHRSLPRFREHGFSDSDRLWIRCLDVSSPAQRRTLFDEITERLGGLDILVNNAGFAYRAVMEHVTDQERLQQLTINFRAPMELIRLALPGMRARRRGKIFNISSVGGMMAMPTMGIYSASKFALEGASEALWYELRPFGISVTLIQPGFINSPSFERVKYTPESGSALKQQSDPYHEYYDSMAPFIERLMRSSYATPERIARKITRLAAQKSPPLRVPVTLDAWMFTLLRRYLPRRLYHALLFRMLPGVKHWGSPRPAKLLPLYEKSLPSAENER